MKKHCFLLFMAVMTAINVSAEIFDLQCEGRKAPLGIDTTTPHFSWKHTLTHIGQRQTAYEIQVATDSLALAGGQADLWDTDKVTSAEQVMIAYNGKPLSSRQLCYWRVRTWDEKDKPSEWTLPERFAVGILDEMKGEYIGASSAVSMVRKIVQIDNAGKAPVFAHLNSLGYHDLYVNGEKVGDYVLQPAVSQLDRHSLIVTYDITPYLKEGENEILVWLGQGWYKTTTFKAQYDYPLLKAEINQLSEGTWQTLTQTDATWQSMITGISYTGTWNALMFGGEKVNANYKAVWHDATVFPVANMIATPQLFEGNRITDYLTPVKTTQQADGSLLFDFGRVVVGWLEVVFEGMNKWQQADIEYTDDLPANGTFERQENDVYIANGEGAETFRNRFHHHAFRYVRIRGASKVTNIQAMQISALPKQGNVSTFQCSDDQLNAVHDMIHYTMECLTFSGYMVDCPHLERMGYGGDGNSSTMTLQTMFDVAPTYMNWLSAWSDNVAEDGSLPYVAPTGGGGGGPYWSGFFVKAPWRTYLNYGDPRPMERYYDQMKLWLSYVDKYSVDGLLQPWPDTPNRMWFLGDWLAPNGVDVGGESVIHANNCFISDCLANMTSMARILGKDDDAQQFETWRQRLNETIHEKFFHNTYYANGTQLDMSYALLAGIPPTETIRDRLVRQFVSNCNVKYKKHIGAGLFGVPIFTQWTISDNQPDLMATILRQPDYPGYLNMIANGATATWEYWDGQRSHVHNCYNGIGIWFYQGLAGLRHDGASPGYQHFIVDPQCPSDITWTHATKPTPYGEANVYWKKETADDADLLLIDVTIPVGTTATVFVPTASESTTVYDGETKAADVEGTTYLGYEQGKQMFLVGAGRHVFALHATTGITTPKAKRKGRLTVSLNPAGQTLRWTADSPVSQLRLYNIMGTPLATLPTAESDIDLTPFGKGTYILAATTGKGMLTAKIMRP